MARIRLRIFGIPRSASVIARGHNGKAGHAIAVTLRGSTYLGCYSQKNMVIIDLIMKNSNIIEGKKKSKIIKSKK